MSKPHKPHHQKPKQAPKPMAQEPDSTLVEIEPPRDSEQGETGETKLNFLQRFWNWFLTWRRSPPRE